MSICDGCGGEWGHSPGCPEEAQRRAAQRAREPLERDNEKLAVDNRRLRNALMDVIASRSHPQAVQIARRALED